VFLPKERVLVSGDDVHKMTPFMGDSYPYEWIRTLEAAEALDFDYVIGGHGDIMKGKQTIGLWKQYFHDLLDHTAAAVSDGATLEESQKRVAEFLIAKYADKFTSEFADIVGDNVAKACEVIAFNIH
jgi:glyoxylase-like metal-dependent hydrolase (beta-lactamase superfamily II)